MSADIADHDITSGIYPVAEIVRRLPTYFTISFASKRNSGKTFLISQLIRELLAQKRVDMVVVMSGSAGLNDDYAFLPSRLVMPFSEQVLQNIWNKNKATDPKNRKHVLIVLDDCLATPEAIRNPTVSRYFALGRHISSSFIVSSQHAAVLLSPLIKQNSDLLLWSKLNRQMLETLHSSTTNLSKKAFIAFAEEFGGVEYNFCVLDNIIASSDPAAFLTVVRADAPPG